MAYGSVNMPLLVGVGTTGNHILAEVLRASERFEMPLYRAILSVGSHSDVGIVEEFQDVAKISMISGAGGSIDEGSRMYSQVKPVAQDEINKLKRLAGPISWVVIFSSTEGGMTGVLTNREETYLSVEERGEAPRLKSLLLDDLVNILGVRNLWLVMLGPDYERKPDMISQDLYNFMNTYWRLNLYISQFRHKMKRDPTAGITVTLLTRRLLGSTFQEQIRKTAKLVSLVLGATSIGEMQEKEGEQGELPDARDMMKNLTAFREEMMIPDERHPESSRKMVYCFNWWSTFYHSEVEVEGGLLWGSPEPQEINNQVLAILKDGIPSGFLTNHVRYGGSDIGWFTISTGPPEYISNVNILKTVRSMVGESLKRAWRRMIAEGPSELSQACRDSIIDRDPSVVLLSKAIGGFSMGKDKVDTLVFVKGISIGLPDFG